MSSVTNVNQEASYIELDSLKRNNGKVTPLGYTNESKKDELKNEYDAEYILKNSNTLFWRVLRFALQITILVAFVGLLAFIVAVIIIHPGCEKAPGLEWWQKSLIYRVEVEKFKDLKDSETVFTVLKDNVDYFENNNADAIWLSNIIDLNFDFTTISASYGSLEEFKELVKELHEKNIKVILDFLPNYTTDKSQWFLKSKQNDEEYRDYYTWSNQANNWQSENGLSAWSLSDNGKFYYHKYGQNKPDLNYRNPKVVQELHTALKYWLETTGIDGFNLVGSSYLFEDYLLRNEVKINEYTQHQRETFYLLAEIKDLLNQYTTNTSREILLMNAGLADEAENNLDDSIIQKYYGNKKIGQRIDIVAFKKLFKQQNVNGNTFIKTVNELIKKYESFDTLPIWMLDESNMQLSNVNQSLVNILHASFMFLPGSSVIQLHNEDYESFVKNTTKEDSNNLLTRSAKLRRDTESIKYSKIKYNENENDCGITEFVKYYDGKYSFSFHFDLENSSCTNDRFKLKSNLIKDNSISVKFVNTQYSDNASLVKKLKDVEKISFNSKGETSVEVPRHAFIVLSWPFQPPDIKDVL